MGASLGLYLMVWLAAGWIGAAVAIWLAWREAQRRDLLHGLKPSLTGLARENAGVWRFSIFSNLHYSIALIPTQLSTLLVGAVLGPAAAGLFKVAREVGTGLMKPVELVNQALYPDLARLVATQHWSRLGRAAVRAGLIAGGVGLVVTLLVLLMGRPLLMAVFGKEFGDAAPLLALLSCATMVRVLAFAADPIMYALDRPSAPLRIAIVTNLIFVAMLVWRLPVDGLIGAGWSYLVLGANAGLFSALWARRLIGTGPPSRLNRPAVDAVGTERPREPELCWRSPALITKSPDRLASLPIQRGVCTRTSPICARSSCSWP
jgi:O-antigen/teichoic acid export membrane protein